ncbi:DNA-binding protein [Bacteroides clarus]|uniref:HU family DNA-binding protein n=1 Tax=Bacteroides clarus TaxID=626929 RepID=UPI003A882B8C|nr:DNA-binding protein [Bacteroides sp.]
MATALVVRTQRYKKIGDKASPLVYTLKRKPRDAKMYDLKRIAEEIEALGGMSAEDVLHVGKAIVRNMREKLTDGNSVRLDDFGIFRTSFHCVATEHPKDCTVKNIDKVRINFKVATTLRLVNDSVATTKGAANNVSFELVSADGSTAPGGNGGGGNIGGEEENPLG